MKKTIYNNKQKLYIESKKKIEQIKINRFYGNRMRK